MPDDVLEWVPTREKNIFSATSDCIDLTSQTFTSFFNFYQRSRVLLSKQSKTYTKGSLLVVVLGTLSSYVNIYCIKIYKN